MRLLKIRLGGRCNQHCSFCHSNTGDSYKLNPQLFDFIKYNGITRINYGGGEPLMYWDIIKLFVEKFPDIDHATVSNGSLLTKDKLDFINDHNMHIGVSLNEFSHFNNENYYVMSRIRSLGTAVIYTGEKSLEDIDRMIYNFSIKIHRPIGSRYNLMHTTHINSLAYTQETADTYIDGMKQRILIALLDYEKGRVNRYSVILNTLCTPSTYNRCSDYFFIPVSLDGRFMSCPYDCSYTGDIGHARTHIPGPLYDECEDCFIKEKCMTCIKNINRWECYIYQAVYKYFYDLLDSHSISLYDLQVFFHNNSPNALKFDNKGGIVGVRNSI